MKVVINRCFGGFGLSDEAMMLYGHKKGKQLYRYKSDMHENITMINEPDRFLTFYFSEPNLTNWPEDKTLCVADCDIPRDDPDLVSVVEELGNRASGQYAKLSVVEIPDGIE